MPAEIDIRYLDQGLHGVFCRRGFASYIETTMNKHKWRSTTILSIRKGPTVIVAGDGQVTLGATVMKANARKVRRLGKGDVIAGFAGATADAFALFERLEAKLEQHQGNLARACVELGRIGAPTAICAGWKP